MDIESKDRVPATRTARQELPDGEAVRALGLEMSVEEARLCVVVWSWFLADGNAKTRSPLYQAMYCLGFAAAISLRRDGVSEAAPHPQLRGVAWPQPLSVFRGLGIDHLDLAAYWRGAKNEADDACYPLAWLTAFFPPPIWPMLLTLIRWGPERAAVQFEQAAIEMGQTPIKHATRRRAAGSLTARSTVDTRLSSVWRVMRLLVALRTRAKASPRPTLRLDLLEPWTHQPPRPNLVDCGTVPSGMDNSGPSLVECRRRLRELVCALDEHPEFPEMRLRRVVLFVLFLLLGPRADAVRVAQVADYDPERRWPDGELRPTLTIRPGKTREHHEQHYLPLPNEVASWLERWIAFTGKKYGYGPRPLFPGRVSKGQPLLPLSQPGFYCAIAGRRGPSGTGQHALVSLNGDTYTGMRPHGFRKVSSELAHQGAVALKKKHPGVYDHLTPEHFSRALLAHSLVQSVSDVYRSLDAQRLTSLVVGEAWKILWHGDDPSNDVDAKVAPHSIQEQVDALALDLLRLKRAAGNAQLAAELAEHAEALNALADAAARAA